MDLNQPRFYCKSIARIGETLKLDTSEARHLSGPRRHRAGDQVALFDGQGTVGVAEVEKIKGFVSVERFESIAHSGRFVSISTWEDMDGNTAVTTKAVDIAVSLGMVCVTAAGNENGGEWNHIIAPADADSVIAVGAVDKDGEIATFSSRGPSYDGRIKPELCALGVKTYCARPGSNNPYGNVSGTSLATPLVAGAAAVLLSAHPDWTPMMVREALMGTASRWLIPDNDYGWGIVDVWAAINYGNFTTSVKDENFIPNEFSIVKAYPNPFNPKINLYFELYDNDVMEISVYDIQGKKVRSLYSGRMDRGTHSITWDGKEDAGRSVPSGLYFISFKTNSHTETRKISLVR